MIKKYLGSVTSPYSSFTSHLVESVSINDDSSLISLHNAIMSMIASWGLTHFYKKRSTFFFLMLHLMLPDWYFMEMCLSDHVACKSFFSTRHPFLIKLPLYRCHKRKTKADAAAGFLYCSIETTKLWFKSCKNLVAKQTHGSRWHKHWSKVMSK